MMFIAKKATITPFGMSGAPAASAGSIAAESATRAAKARNQGTARRGPAKSSARTEQEKAQSETAEELANPPRLHCSAKGSRRLMKSWLVRNRRKRRKRAN